MRNKKEMLFIIVGISIVILVIVLHIVIALYLIQKHEMQQATLRALANQKDTTCVVKTRKGNEMHVWVGKYK